MADLIDRLSGESNDLPIPRPKLHNFQFTGGLRLYAMGVITAPELIAEWDLQGDELTQANTLKAAIDAASTVVDKLVIVMRVEAIAGLLEDDEDTLYHTSLHGPVNKTKAIADLNL